MKPSAVLLFCIFAALPLTAQDYALGPDSQTQSGVPKGVVTKHKLAPGKYYPGTPHNYSIYVPAQYDKAKPTPFMIYLDGSGALGNGQRVPVVFDNLIAKHQIPAMIGIFVDPGVLPAIGSDAQSRFERVFEYDSLSERFSNFLIDELIPEVAKDYNLSKNPDDRGLEGVSTGAVGAFMAAWNRPDQFRRVLSFIGTFVAMKGGDGVAAMIRKTEAKPLRVFLQAGKNDHLAPNQPYGTFYAGSWPMNNRVMLEALQYAGYDAKLELGEEGHNMKQGAAIMPDALRWLWRDYPTPITVHEPAQMDKDAWDPRGKVSSTVWANKPWERLAGTYKSITSPTADKAGNIYFADTASGNVYKADATGKITTLLPNAGAHAIAMGGDERLYVADTAHSSIASYSVDGKDRRIAASAVQATALVGTAHGSLYFVDAAHKSIGVADGKGKTRVAFNGTGLATPSGLALSPDQAMLIVTDSQSRYSWSFQIAGDGTLINGEPFFRLELPEESATSEVRGATEDSIGQVYFATPIGIQMCEANGRVAVILNPPGRGQVTGLTFAGPAMDWLAVTQGDSIYRRPTKVKGVPASTVAKLPKPPL